MKTKSYHFLPSFLLILMLLVLPGCLDVFFTTEVHSNGSITKTVVFEGDSAEILEIQFPFMADSTWESSWSVTDDDKSRLWMSKTFSSAKQAAKDLNPNDSIPYIRIQPELKRKFRWFFTYLEYEDIMLCPNPFQKLDWRDFLSEKAIELIVMDEDEREALEDYDDEEYELMEEQLERYIISSGVEEVFQLFVLAFDRTPSSALSKSLIASKKEDILEHLNTVEPDMETTDDVLNSFRAVLGAENVNLIYQQNPDIFAYFDSKIDFFDEAFDDNYRFEIQMPGLLINTNSNEIEGNKMSWEMDFFDAFFLDLPMSAESRIVNIWAFIITGIAIGFLLFGLIWRLFRRKKD